MSTYFTADTHFNHSNIIQFCNRPFASVELMNETLIKNWNNTIKNGDVVYVLGDFCFGGSGKYAETLTRLNGKKFLIRGNHDIEKDKNYIKGFEAILNQCILNISHKKQIKLCHYPYAPSIWTRFFKRYILKYSDKRPKKEGMWLLHGHSHCGVKIDVKNKQINVGVDLWGYTPISSDKIIEIIEKNS